MSEQSVRHRFLALPSEQRLKLDRVTSPRCQLTPVPNLSTSAILDINDTSITVTGDDFEDTCILGEGFFGQVFKMRLKSTKESFAVKKIPFCNLDPRNPDMIADLEIGKLHPHPFLLRSYCAFTHVDSVWILLELMDISLDVLLNKVKALNEYIPENVLKHITFSIVSALYYLRFDMNMIHRDIKPANMLANKCGEIKLGDFGTAVTLSNCEILTDVGSWRYLAPERVSCGSIKSYGVKSDIWSLGLSIYELATGTNPYEPPKDPVDAFNQIVNRDPPSLSSDLPYSNHLRDFLNMCLIKEVSERADYNDLLVSDFIRSVDVNSHSITTAQFLMKYI
ncbi:unnamed protein product [Schistosoma bovis]|uniref:mitogen-activated protein kinase kinase n=1 Tax=Schistosoma bovis TaxID=6184 RepID=A0A430QPB1_SCHBO|nr:mitogen-activated protein kinase kinase 3 [Schistosoma bovis]CAH8436580.1 unnamed protein product [Schistosoma bovis]CAH8436618.1 unnamed protein product [Schistosoma bovis]